MEMVTTGTSLTEAIGILTAIGVFIGPIIAIRLQEMRREQNERLKVHFEDLKREGQSKISMMQSTLYEWQRKINVNDSSAPPSGTELRELSSSFAAHFPEEAKDYSKYKQKMIKHNKKYEQLRLTIEDDFASKGIPKASTSTNPVTCVYDITFVALFRWWEDLIKNVPHPQPDFIQIEPKQSNQGYYLYASGLGASPVAYAENDADKDKLERALLEIAQNKGYKGETAKLLNSYKSLSQELQTYWSRLNEKLEGIEKYWPGPKRHEFRKIKDCSKCKEI
jgi:hypothetical protein